MKKVLYTITSSTVMIEEHPVQSYGISCYVDDREEKKIDDISTDKKAVEIAIRKFNKYHLSPSHFKDAVEDFLE